MRGVGDALRVAVVHRPRHDDWSIPKGKAEPGETSEQTALREVAEELGIAARMIGHLGESTHKIDEDRTKVVDFFVMRPVEPGTPEFEPNEEVDEVEWLPIDAVTERLNYDGDRRLVESPEFGRLARTGRVHLLRHANAGSRKDWSGDDRSRPLNRKGTRQAEAIAERLTPQGVDRIFTSAYDRCVQTVEPLSERTGVPIEPLDGLAESSPLSEVLETIERLSGLEVVMSSHGDMIPAILRDLEGKGMELESPTGVFDCKKGSIWEVIVEDGTPARAIYRPPPG